MRKSFGPEKHLLIIDSVRDSALSGAMHYQPRTLADSIPGGGTRPENQNSQESQSAPQTGVLGRKAIPERVITDNRNKIKKSRVATCECSCSARFFFGHSDCLERLAAWARIAPLGRRPIHWKSTSGSRRASSRASGTHAATPGRRRQDDREPQDESADLRDIIDQ